MQHIDEKFKDMKPEETVNRIINILNNVGINLVERWNNSGIDNCWSLSVTVEGGGPSSNGKGISREFARASAYGEFIERLQSGLFFYKYQSIERDSEMNLHTFAPDGKYMTMQELEENGDWMDHIIHTYGGSLTRKKIAQQAKMYACTDEDRILTIPFYSLFEDKYVYLPAGFAEHMYSANGCCVGNTKEEAWVHALSEIMERKCKITMLMNATAAAQVPDDILETFPTVKKILAKIRENGKYDIKVFDFSMGNGFPVVTTRIINKETKGYVLNTAADPVLEIAVERTLTEIFQGRNIDTFSSQHSGQILNKISDFPITHNVLNLLETGNGLFAADFFAEEICCDRPCAQFDDNSNKTNKELLHIMLEMYRTFDKPVYVRNYSFLGFCCYKFIVPGFSESRGVRLNESPSEYALGDEVARTLKNPITASEEDHMLALMFHKKMRTAFSCYDSFPRLAGVPLSYACGRNLLSVTMSYSAYRVKKYTDAVQYLEKLNKSDSVDKETKEYFACVSLYLKLKSSGISEEKIHCIVDKFSEKQYVQKMYEALDKGNSPYDEFLLKCNCSNCADCRYHSECTYSKCKAMIANAGVEYKKFVDGQAREEFLFK